MDKTEITERNANEKALPYEAPVIEIIRFEDTDIVTISDPEEDENEGEMV